MKVALQFFAVTLLGSLLISSGCKKGGDDGGDNSNEANLAVTTNPASGSVLAASVGPFNLSVTITSAMPPSGVKIEITARRDDGTNPAPFYSQNTNTSSGSNNFTITNAPALVQSLVDIKVTSLTKPTNVWSGSYRFTSK